MKAKISRFPGLSLAVVAMLAILNAPLSTLHAQGTAFTYQGRLSASGNPASGSYDFRFRLASDALGNNYVGSPVTTNAVPVANGLFTVALDFGGVFSGSSYWLEIDVRTNGAGGYAILSPLQPITPAPYAITAENLNGTVPVSQLSGTVPLAQLPSVVLTNNESGVALGSLTLNGNLNLLATSSGAGII